jgi:hypothetical protein
MSENPFSFDNNKVEDEEESRYPIPIPEVKLNVHTLLNRVLDTKDSTKVGFLSEAELGSPINPVRVLKEMSLISNTICNNPFFANYFALEAENVLATSLSRKGKFLNIAVTQKRTIADETKQMGDQKKSSWFSKKQEKNNDEE